MNYFKIIYRTGEEDWETSEIIIDENQHNKIQEQLSGGSDMIFVKDRATIKRSCITSIGSANDIIANYQKQGIKIDGLGLLEPAEKPKEIAGGVRKFGDIFKEKKDEFYQRMGWK